MTIGGGDITNSIVGVIVGGCAVGGLSQLALVIVGVGKCGLSRGGIGEDVAQCIIGVAVSLGNIAGVDQAADLGGGPGIRDIFVVVGFGVDTGIDRAEPPQGIADK